MIRLHLGCGFRHVDGYRGIDVREEVNPDVVADAQYLHRYYEHGTVDEIYAGHLLEHLPDWRTALLNWNAVLRQHGILRLAVPDIGNAMLAYVNSGVSLSRLLGIFWGGQSYKGDRHYVGWDYETLAAHLRQFGYYDIRRWNPWDLFPEGYDDCSYARIEASDGRVYSMSLNLEGKKR